MFEWFFESFSFFRSFSVRNRSNFYDSRRIGEIWDYLWNFGKYFRWIRWKINCDSLLIINRNVFFKILLFVEYFCLINKINKVLLAMKKIFVKRIWYRLKMMSSWWYKYRRRREIKYPWMLKEANSKENCTLGWNRNWNGILSWSNFLWKHRRSLHIFSENNRILTTF